MLNDNGIAWMIAGGVREASHEDQRQLLHRIALAECTPSRTDALRRRLVAILGARPEAPTARSLAPDCCPA